MKPRYLSPNEVARLVQRAQARDISMSNIESIALTLANCKYDYAVEAEIIVGRILEARRVAAREEGINIEKNRRKEGYFDWPDTHAPASRYGFAGDIFSYKDGLLSYVGYKVGFDGVSVATRHKILDCVFHNSLPNVDSEHYMNEWASPESAARLQKLAEAIAAFARNAKRNNHADYSKAIRDWQQDLDYLYRKYYIDHFQFSWPCDL